ncbi:TolC family protein [Pedobacter sp. MW01-1-1]|uniref:TolC family protein n=1 Tax=Pedobacter sp. MW01-1-1 TaxID=3383027 RepID=UPI003FED7A9F
MKKITRDKFLVAATFALVIGLSQGAQAQKVITLQQAVDSTLKNNLQIKQAAFSAAVTDETLKQSQYALLPTLGLNGQQNMGWGRNNYGNTGIYQNTQTYNLNLNAGVNVDLFGGLAKINQIRQNKISLEADKTNVDKIKNDLILQVVTAYMQVLYNRDLLKASADQLDVSTKTLTRSNALLEAGRGTVADVSQAKSQVATAELGVTNAQNTLTISYLTLAQLMEIPGNSQFEVEAPLESALKSDVNKYESQTVFESAMQSFPDIKLASLRTKVAEKAIDIAKGSYYPTLSMGAGYGSNYIYQYNSLASNNPFWDQLDNNQSKNISMTLRIPVFSGFNARTNVRKAKINYNNAVVSEQLAKNSLNKIVSQAVADLTAAQSRYASTQNAFNAQKDAYYAVEQRFGVGLVNSLDLSTALTNRNKAEIDFIQAKYDLLFRAKVIDYYLGKPITF